jgi:putative FmdB family regulatory protein
MPSYEYKCTKCNKKFTAIFSIGEHDAGKVKCPKCGGKKLEQLITAFQVKTSRKQISNTQVQIPRRQKMSSKKVLILYYSGSTQKMAKAIADAMMIFAEEEPASRSAQ